MLITAENLEMYNHLISALHYVIRGVSGDEWTPEFETAWQQRIDYLNSEIRTTANRNIFSNR